MVSKLRLRRGHSHEKSKAQKIAYARALREEFLKELKGDLYD